MFRRILDPLDVKVINYYLNSEDEKKIKRGLQYLCNAIENEHKKISDCQFNSFFKRVSVLIFSDDISVRRWIYKLIALLKVEAYIPYLLGQLINEADEENKTWACAAIFSIQNFEDALKTFNRSELYFYNTRYQLAASFFRKDFDFLFKKSQINSLIDVDPLACKWVSLLFGKEHNFFQKDLVLDLSLHHNQEVVEYSIWAFHQRKRGSIKDIIISPQDINRFQPNVRRWYYRLLTKDWKNIYLYFDLIKSVISAENNFSVREGLAQGLTNIYLDSKFSELIVEWYFSENDDLVKLQLLNHLLGNLKKNSRIYKPALENILNSTVDEHIYHLVLSQLDSNKQRKFFFFKDDFREPSLILYPKYPRESEIQSRPIIRDKDALAVSRQATKDMKDIATLALIALNERNNTINIDVNATAEGKAMNQSADHSRKIEVGDIGGDFNASGQALNLGEIDVSGQISNAINQIPDEPKSSDKPELKSLLIQLKEAVQEASELSASERMILLEQVKIIAEIGKSSDSEQKTSVAQKAKDIFSAILKSLPDTAKIVDTVGKLLPLIIKGLGL